MALDPIQASSAIIAQNLKVGNKSKDLKANTGRYLMIVNTGKEKKVTARVCEYNDENNNLRRGVRILRAAWRYEWLPEAFSKGAIRGPRRL